jgi:hypothetical protein
VNLSLLLRLSLSHSLSLSLHPSKDAAVGAWVSKCWNRPSLGRINMRLEPIAKEFSSHDTVKGKKKIKYDIKNNSGFAVRKTNERTNNNNMNGPVL